MIALHFQIPLNEVEERDIKEYRLMLFTVFNNAILHSMDASKFQFQSDEENMSEFKLQIEDAKKRGLL